MEREQFILYSTDIPVAGLIFDFEGEAQRAAETSARSNRGARVYVAKLIASVQEPLPALQWSDDRPAGDGRQSRGLLMGLSGSSNPSNPSDCNTKASR